MNIEDTVEFLRNVAPFQDLDEATLRDVAAGVSVEFYPKGTSILQQDGPASEYLRIVKKGQVKVFIKSGKDDEEFAIDTRSEGDAFGFLSLVSGDKSRANVVVAEDATCYLIGRGAIIELLEKYPGFAEYFLVSFLNKYIDKTYKEIHKRSPLYGGGDRLLFTTPLGDLITKEVITASQEISIKEAAEVMSRNWISSLVLLDDGIPAGIVTDRDLRDKVVSKGRSVQDPVKGIMSVSLIKAEAKDYCFEALLNMIRYGVHHILVIDSGKLRGVITNHDLMMLQGTSPISIAREIESQQSIEGLVPASKKINKIVELLIKEGAKASNITRIITEINDRLMRKVIEITEKKLGQPPLDYCWIVFGSEGRKEQTFKTDQDNAIIYADPETPEEAEAAKTYFSALTLLVRDGMLKCGFSLCPADYMASNQQWCQPFKVWKKYFAAWINEPKADAVLKSLIFFDFRPVCGDFGLAEELRNALTAALDNETLFLGFMANTIIKNTPPVGFLKSFVVKKSGEHKDEFDLKIKGIAPLIDAVRLFALEKGVKETSTLERIDALKDVHAVVKESAEELEYAFEFIMLLRIRHQFEQIKSGRQPDNFINPYKLSNIEKKIIKDTFSLISKMQDFVIERYKLSIW